MTNEQEKYYELGYEDGIKSGSVVENNLLKQIKEREKGIFSSFLEGYVTGLSAGLNELENKYCELSKLFYGKIKELNNFLEKCMDEDSEEYKKIYRIWKKLLDENN